MLFVGPGDLDLVWSLYYYGWDIKCHGSSGFCSSLQHTCNTAGIKPISTIASSGPHSREKPNILRITLIWGRMLVPTHTEQYYHFPKWITCLYLDSSTLGCLLSGCVLMVKVWWSITLSSTTEMFWVLFGDRSHILRWANGKAPCPWNFSWHNKWCVDILQRRLALRSDTLSSLWLFQVAAEPVKLMYNIYIYIFLWVISKYVWTTNNNQKIHVYC